MEKGHLLRCKRCPFTNVLTINELRTHNDIRHKRIQKEVNNV